MYSKWRRVVVEVVEEKCCLGEADSHEGSLVGILGTFLARIGGRLESHGAELRAPKLHLKC